MVSLSFVCVSHRTRRRLYQKLLAPPDEYIDNRKRHIPKQNSQRELFAGRGEACFAYQCKRNVFALHLESGRDKSKNSAFNKNSRLRSLVDNKRPHRSQNKSVRICPVAPPAFLNNWRRQGSPFIRAQGI